MGAQGARAQSEPFANMWCQEPRGTYWDWSFIIFLSSLHRCSYLFLFPGRVFLLTLIHVFSFGYIGHVPAQRGKRLGLAKAFFVT